MHCVRLLRRVRVYRSEVSIADIGAGPGQAGRCVLLWINDAMAGARYVSPRQKQEESMGQTANPPPFHPSFYFSPLPTLAITGANDCPLPRLLRSVRSIEFRPALSLSLAVCWPSGRSRVLITFTRGCNNPGSLRRVAHPPTYLT